MAKKASLTILKNETFEVIFKHCKDLINLKKQFVFEYQKWKVCKIIIIFLTSMSLLAGALSEAKYSSAKSAFWISLAICWCCAVVVMTAVLAALAGIESSNIFRLKTRIWKKEHHLWYKIMRSSHKACQVLWHLLNSWHICNCNLRGEPPLKRYSQ